jgi:hypothetical protein
MMARAFVLPAILAAALRAAMAAEPSAEQLLPTRNAQDAYTPAAAYGGKLFLVAWQSGRLAPGDLRKGAVYNGDIVGFRVDRAGRGLDSQPFLIGGAPHLQELPRVASNGELFLVVWQDFRNGRDWDVYAARVNAAGRVLDPGGLLVSGGPSNQAKPQVAWDGRNFVVVWQDFRSGRWYGVYSARVSAQGVVLEKEGVRLAETPAGNCSSPRIAPAGPGRAFALSIGGQGVPGSAAPTTGMFLADGKPEGPPAYSIINRDVQEPDGPHGNALPAALAFSGEEFLLAWTTDAPFSRGQARNKFNMALLDRKAAVKSQFLLAGANPEKRIIAPDAAWDGSAFVVAWHEQVGDPPRGSPYDAVFAARIRPKRAEPAAATRIAGKFEAPAVNTAVASDGAGASLVVYEKHPEKAEVPITIGYRLLR